MTPEMIILYKVAMGLGTAGFIVFLIFISVMYDNKRLRDLKVSKDEREWVKLEMSKQTRIISEKLKLKRLDNEAKELDIKLLEKETNKLALKIKHLTLQGNGLQIEKSESNRVLDLKEDIKKALLELELKKSNCPPKRISFYRQSL